MTQNVFAWVVRGNVFRVALEKQIQLGGDQTFFAENTIGRTRALLMFRDLE